MATVLQRKTVQYLLVLPEVENGTTGTQYYNADNRDRLVMMEALMIDYLDDLIQVNADHLRELLMGEDEE